jgi:ubiquitin-activating enzyme E1
MKIVDRKEMHLIEFEKDDPTNWHIEFLSALSNLRARNYKINEVPNFNVKIIAGKIIPALATATAMVVGATGIEIIKVLQVRLNYLFFQNNHFILKKGSPLSKIKNSFMNLALPLWLFSEPLAPIKAVDKDYDPIVLGPIKAVPPGN